MRPLFIKFLISFWKLKGVTKGKNFFFDILLLLFNSLSDFIDLMKYSNGFWVSLVLIDLFIKIVHNFKNKFLSVLVKILFTKYGKVMLDKTKYAASYPQIFLFALKNSQSIKKILSLLKKIFYNVRSPWMNLIFL